MSKNRNTRRRKVFGVPGKAKPRKYSSNISCRTKVLQYKDTETAKYDLSNLQQEIRTKVSATQKGRRNHPWQGKGAAGHEFVWNSREDHCRPTR